jgi:pimeloyl-ACP methyl ester carboxylesterase
MTTTILYIPGLGDHYDGFRKKAVAKWKLPGVRAELVSIVWYDGASFEEKMRRITTAIDRVAPKSDRIVLIGESAGGTLALHAAGIDLRVSKVITLCGVTRRNTPISNYLRRRAPALDTAVGTIPEELEVPVESIRAVSDSVVGKRYSVAPNAKEHVLWSIGHFMTIMLCLTVLAPYVMRIAKRT